MCDLIDFNSPSTQNSIRSKLASPLIPSPETPTTSANSTPNTVVRPSSSRNGKRSKWNDNPFDLALHNMMEYASKKEDPFEVVFEKALKCKNQCNMPKTCIEFKDDFTLTRKKPFEIPKMNKTLDESSMNIHLNTSSYTKDPVLNMIEDDSIIQDLNNTNLLSDTCKNKEDCVSMKDNTMPNIKVEPSSPLETSILSQSLLNDTLSEISLNSLEQKNTLSSSIYAQTKNVGTTKLSSNEVFKFSKHHRSLSAKETKSPKNLIQYSVRSHSTAEILKLRASETSSVSSLPSVLFDDSMNKAFLEPRISSSSFQTDISNISNTSKLNSTSRYDYSSSIFSDGSMNRAFVDSCSSAKCSKGFDFSSPALRRLKSASSLNTANNTSSASNSSDMSHLVSTLQRIRINSTNIPTSPIETVRSDVNEMNCISDKIDQDIINPTVSANQPEMESKLLDIDVFHPEMENHAERNAKNSTSSLSSTDSVFAVNSKLATSIIEEANALAKLFGELAYKSESTISSSDDLVNSRPRWNFDELPPSDDEQDVENLIELPVSPSNPESIMDERSELEIIKENKLLDLNDVKKKTEVMNELEKGFINPTTSDNKIMAATLLFDLEKLVKLENNLEAATLLHNLEKALGVKCENNVELLTACLENTNDLGKSPKKFNSGKAIDNIQAENIEKSHEDNTNIDKPLNTLELNDSACKDLANNFNTDEGVNKAEKMLGITQNALGEIVPMTEEIGETSDTVFDDSILLEKEKNHALSEQKIAAELLISIGKALSGENKDQSSINLLASVGKILNVSSSYLNSERSRQNNSEEGEKKTPTKKTVIKSKVQYPSNLSKSMNRRSLESSSKEHSANEKLPRRSLSGSRASGTYGTSVSIEKTKSLPRDMKKQFSSDSDITNRRSTLKDVKVKPVAVPDIRREKAPTLVNTVKNKLRKKSDADVIKKGPMKAIVPLGNMQRRGSLGKRVAPSLGSITPPKLGFTTPSAFTVTNSTPNSSFNIPVVKKSPKAKPVASSTPDADVSKARRIVSQLSQTGMKRNVSCNISPVIPDTNTNNATTTSKGSPRVARHNKTLSPQKGQSPRSGHVHNKTECSIPKYSPLVGLARKNSFSESARDQDRFGSPKSSLTKSCLPLSKRKSESELLQSNPLKNNNKQCTKIKPLNLFSKLHRRSGTTAEKENQS
ncbi:uncharacterized protein LOC107263586 [Cephus cinctus]|uniref:Uncharacterized protein LOC107263586 n=1 Tax=Cephus cinctus TaxID=211228 RepID=A0AAJ7FDH9_CEPCN|nr:uncharacterized protein LOC107263586 [Cephus cinctus]XP_015586429.1 uncharacterized protein LOC107263586 [Cephus cinctus]